MILEICANSFKSAQIAQKAGADRIELCENLSIGGVTPSQTLLKKVRSQLSIETHVLIRPRGGNFCYTDEELGQMEQDILFCKKLGFSGVVSGALTPEGALDRGATQRLFDAAQGLAFTFHRAIDVSQNPRQLLRETILMGVTRVLSSGAQTTAEKGLRELQEFLKIAEDNIEIMPGGGITPDNALLFKKAGFEMIHSSATQKHTTSEAGFFTNGAVGTSDPDRIKQLLLILK